MFHIFRKFKVASTLNLVGLCIALISFFLFFSKVEETVNYNTCFKDWKKMYRVELDGQIFSNDSIRIANVPAPAKNILTKIPHVEDVALIDIVGYTIPFSSNAKDGEHETYYYKYYDGYAETLDFFSIKYLYSDKQHIDGDITIPVSLAKKKYGKENVVGDSLEWEINGKKMKKRISGVYADFPKNCCITNGIYQYGDNQTANDFRNFNYHAYIKLDNVDNIKDVEQDILKAFYKTSNPEGNYQEFLTESKFSIKLQRLHDTYFSFVDQVADRGNWHTIIILFLSALFIIVLTNVNNMNYTLALAPIRVKNINTRKVIGASRCNLMASLIIESILLGLIAYIISLIVLFLADVFVEGVISPLAHIRISIYTFIVCIIISISSSLYPAFYVTSFPTSVALKGAFRLPKRSRTFRAVRVGFQIILSSIALTCSTTFILQQNFIFSTEYGYLKNQIIFGKINSQEALSHKDKLIEAFKQNKNVKSVSFSVFEIGTEDRYMIWQRSFEHGKYSLMTTVLPVDYNYLKTLGIEITDGQDFTKNDKGAYIFNETARKKYPWLKTGQPIFLNSNSPHNYKVAGFCNDIVFSSLRHNNIDKALCFIVPGDNSPEMEMIKERMNIVNIRLKDHAKIDEVRKQLIETYYSLFPNNESVFETSTFNEKLKELYEHDITFFTQMLFIALIYIAITLIGVFCLTLFDSEHRRKEIGIRKVFGATTLEILMMFNKRYFLSVCICYVISIPISIWLIDSVLADYSIICPYMWIAYPISAILMICMILGTVTLQSWRNATEEAVHSIKDE
ncbi:MAG: FtsX-like permease family protein [Bacteroidaceae bacterium]|nr:FtsX-like permease family protein [Bacteroidaceae bacterium]